MIVDFQEKKKSYCRRIAPISTRSAELDRAVKQFSKLPYDERRRIIDKLKSIADVYILGGPGCVCDYEEYRFCMDILTRNKTRKQIKEIINDDYSAGRR